MVKEEKKVDMYDMMDPVDILTKHNAEWVDKLLEMKSWKEKKEALDQLIAEASVPKLKTGDYMGLTKMLKKLVVDANVVVS
jgi:predicted peroxiredoxin